MKKSCVTNKIPSRSRKRDYK